MLIDALSPEEHVKMEIDQGRYVQKMRSAHGESPEAMRNTNGAISRNTRSSIRSIRREILVSIVNDKGLVRPAFTSA